MTLAPYRAHLELKRIDSPTRRRTSCGIVWASRSELQIEKNPLRGFLEKKFLVGAAPWLIPTGARNFNGLTPAIIEALNRYPKPPSALPFKFSSRPGRAIWRRLHLLQQILVTVALRGVLGEWPKYLAVLGQVWRAKFRPARFQAYGKEGFVRRHAHQ
jgi:hypothetical protein